VRQFLCRFALGLAALAATGFVRGAEPPPFAWKDGDRVVMIGDDLIERDQKYGYFETMVTALNPDKTITFRNLGWSGDTVYGHARASFGSPADGFKQLKAGVLGLKPTVILVGYGMAESFDGEAGLSRFVSGLNTLLDALAETKARIVLLSPIAHEKLENPLPDPAAHNRDLRRYSDAIRDVARDRGHTFIDLFEPLAIYDFVQRTSKKPVDHQTDDGIHLNALGAYAFGVELASDLKLDPVGMGSILLLHRDGKVESAERAKVSRVESTPQVLRFTSTGDTLPKPRFPQTGRSMFSLRLYVENLEPGRYVLKVDGKPVKTADAKEWDEGALVEKGPEFDQVEALRSAINEKNQLYFYRWRPQNETYLFGFRKHEQGNNGREIPLFDPLVAAKEKEIAGLRVPVSHLYELTREGEVSK